jgi:hypothetical protein
MVEALVEALVEGYSGVIWWRHLVEGFGGGKLWRRWWRRCPNPNLATPAGHPRSAMTRVSSAFTVLAICYLSATVMLCWRRFDRRTVCMATFLCMVARKIECENSIHACMQAQVHMMLLPILATAVCATLGPGDELPPDLLWNELDGVRLACYRSALAMWPNIRRLCAVLERQHACKHWK